ncbi:hypothetical protein ABZ807_26405 [Micromonospora sp. NPDC047548]|uniref:hypothetical protein n=1 Tax=Micromonospora sp. NPDC047548 TaxID=3155624 RepID=UPI0033F04D61
MNNEKLRLSVAVPTGQRVFAAMVGLLFGVVATAFVLLPLLADGMTRRMLGTDDPLTSYQNGRDLPPELLPPELREPSTTGLGAGRFIGLCGVPFALLGLYLVLRVLRTAAWLEGTRVTVRAAFGARTVDLADADITAGRLTFRDANAGPDHVHQVPTLVARDRVTGRTVTVPLRGAGPATLPPHELRALADAMSTGRPTDGRDGDVHVLAGQLRAMAANPLGL